MASYLNFNGKTIKSDTPIVTADSRGLRYGDGLFETMKLTGGQVRFADWHFERLFEGMRVLQMEKRAEMTSGFFLEKISELCKKNECNSLARIRLMVFRGNGGLYDTENHAPNYVIQCFALETAREALNENGMITGIYHKARKTVDGFSHLKSNNYLPYCMAALYAKEQRLNDCILLNSLDRICEASIANVFIVSKDKIYTPSLGEGCVAGIMRRYLLQNLHLAGFDHEEGPLTLSELLAADEVFLTNAVYGMRWVKQCEKASYGSSAVRSIFASLFNKGL